MSAAILHYEIDICHEVLNSVIFCFLKTDILKNTYKGLSFGIDNVVVNTCFSELFSLIKTYMYCFEIATWDSEKYKIVSVLVYLPKLALNDDKLFYKTTC